MARRELVMMPAEVEGRQPAGVDIIVRGASGLCAFLHDGRLIPWALCALAAGPDEWAREVLFPCDTCEGWVAASVLQDGAGSCPACDAEFWCSTCGGHPDDCNNCEKGESE